MLLISLLSTNPLPIFEEIIIKIISESMGVFGAMHVKNIQ
jgi:hypothetical protein